MLAANGWLTATREQNRSIGREGGITSPVGEPPDKAYDLPIDSESLNCIGRIADLNGSVVLEELKENLKSAT